MGEGLYACVKSSNNRKTDIVYLCDVILVAGNFLKEIFLRDGKSSLLKDMGT